MIARKLVAGGILLLSTLLLACLLPGSPASASTYNPGNGVGTVKAGGSSGGGEGSAYTWKVYGNGIGASEGKISPAWKAFVNGSYKPCGTNCRRDFQGTGKYNWSGYLARDCKDSAYIWAKVLREGYINQRGYAESPATAGKHFPKSAGKGAREYTQFRKEAVSYMSYNVPSKYKYVVILCSSALG